MFLLLHLWIVLGTVGNITHEVDPIAYENNTVYSKHTFLQGDEYEGLYAVNIWKIDCKKKRMTRIKHEIFNSDTNELVREEDSELEVPFIKGTYAYYATKEYWCR